MEKHLRCPQYKALIPLVYLNKPIHRDFVDSKIRNHAEKCGECMFWLSHLLALNDAYFTTTRIKSDNEEDPCPPREEIRAILLLALSAIEEFGAGADKNDLAEIRENVEFDESSGDELGLKLVWQHMQSCTLCADYYRELFSKMITWAMGYRKGIEDNATIVPHIQFVASAKEIEVNPLYFHENNPFSKPN
ncbi:MAG: hypothetical protein Q7R94_01590 [bacterium]|nr:hypothetical protein [bacterium]